MSVCIHRAPEKGFKNVTDESVSPKDTDRKLMMIRRNSMPVVSSGSFPSGSSGTELAHSSSMAIEKTSDKILSPTGGDVKEMLQMRAALGLQKASDHGAAEASPLTPRGSKVSNRTRSYGHLYLWGDYFNNLLKCWEPLLESSSFVYVFEEVLILSLY